MQLQTVALRRSRCVPLEPLKVEAVVPLKVEAAVPLQARAEAAGQAAAAGVLRVRVGSAR